MTFKPDPKPVKRKRKQIRIVDKNASANALLSRPACELRCGQRAMNAHHVIPKGAPYFGDDVDANLVCLCGSGTSGCHGDIHHKRVAALGHLGLHIRKRRPDTVRYILDKLGDEKGRDWFMRNFRVNV